MSFTFSRRRPVPTDRCESCGTAVLRVWLVPGDVLNSCAHCYAAATGRQPIHIQGHSTRPPASTRTQEAVRESGRPVASFYLRADGRRPS